MATIIIQTESKSTTKLMLDLAKKLGEKASVLSKDIEEDLIFGSMIKKAKTNKLLSKESILN
ncbi:hypothetical protein EGI22_08715 [Lacihabitans sp. LS3-19]|uniref:hypothetical protein n=1 Tax=Lacihabitans sp. LS3-19 TaxID=2487335 RepID=UPI0020CE3A42|nr:hypothetical protein [Lacihabitans sp. LS3-19]MCP9767993.1 hypothetical protein [Lacihabitans sp. LS3-19]